MSSVRLDRLKEMAARRPDDPFALYGLAMEHKSLGELREAARIFQNLLKHHSQYTAAYLHYGRALLELGDETAARQVFHQGIEACRRVGADHALSELEEAARELGP